MILKRPPYTYRASLIRVIDGDTYELDLDLGFHVHHHTTIRILGWDAAESNTPKGKEVIPVVISLFAAATMILVSTEKDAQTFARWLGRISLDGQDLGETLAARGLVVPMFR